MHLHRGRGGGASVSVSYCPTGSEVCQCDRVAAGGGDQRDTRTVGNDASHDASVFMGCSAHIWVGWRATVGGIFTVQTDY